MRSFQNHTSYTGTKLAVYKLQNTEVIYNVIMPLPVCISNQIERAVETRANRVASYIYEFSYKL